MFHTKNPSNNGGQSFDGFKIFKKMRHKDSQTPNKTGNQPMNFFSDMLNTPVQRYKEVSENESISLENRKFIEGLKNPNLTDLDKASRPFFPESETIPQKSSFLSFPLEVYPERLQKIIQETYIKKRFPIDFTASSMLYAFSVAMGNNFRYNMLNYTGKAVIWIANVGSSGTNKTAPLSFALKPIQKRDKESYQTYKGIKQEFDENSKLPKEEQLPFEFPILAQYLISDFTLEVLSDINENNPHGLGVFADELNSWYANLGRYSSGKDEPHWLSIWNAENDGFTINRKAKTMRFENPFISVCGGIQPAILSELGKNGNSENGFLHRILFAYPHDAKPEYLSAELIDPNASSDYEAILNVLLDIPTKDEPKTLKPDKDASKRLADFDKELTDLQREADSDMECGQISKLKVYSFRLALLFEGIFYACGESQLLYISERAVQASITLIKYFHDCGKRVYKIVKNPENKLLELPQNKQSIYHELPESFKTKDAVKIGSRNGLKERAMKNFIKNTDLFTSVSHGQYEKVSL